MTLTARVIDGASDERIRAEAQLVDRGIGIFPTTRALCASLSPWGSGIVVLERGDARAAEWGFGYLVKRSRAVPGYATYVVPALRAGPPDALQVTMQSLVEHAHERRVLEIQVDAYGPTSSELDALEHALLTLGFHRAQQRRTYSHTLFADIRPPIDALFAELHKTARQNIRAAEKKSLKVVSLRDPSLATRMSQLHRESMERTGGAWHSEDWRRWLEAAEQHPEVVEVIGVYDELRRGPEALVAFSVGMIYGRVGLYWHAGSTRSLRANLPLLYAPLWLLMIWAKRNGAECFDFGGVTGPSSGSGDALAGIASFKRYFSRDLRRVGNEYSLPISRGAHLVARIVRSIAGRS